MFGRKRDRACADQLSQLDAAVAYWKLDVVRVGAVYQTATRGSKVTLENATRGTGGDAWL